jgi:hypothetical protein
MQAGDEVIATRQIGGFVRPEIPPGTRGTVESAGWLSGTRVRFVIETRAGQRDVQVDVDPGDIMTVRRK